MVIVLMLAHLLHSAGILGGACKASSLSKAFAGIGQALLRVNEQG